MKKQFAFILIILAALTYNSCSHKTVEKEEEVGDEVTRQYIDSVIRGQNFTVSEAYKIVGKDSIDLLADPIYKAYNEAVCLTFFQGYVNFFGSKPIPNTQFPATAKTFLVNTRIMLPTNMTYSWDDTKNTYVFESNGTSSYFPIIPSGKKAYLDKSKFNLTDYETAKNALVKPSITFDFEDYVIVMKPMWAYYQEPNQQVTKEFVVF